MKMHNKKVYPFRLQRQKETTTTVTVSARFTVVR